MDVELSRRNWALAVAAVLFVIVAVIVGIALYRRSARGQLAQRARALRTAHAECARAGRAVATAERRVDRLRERADKVKPRLLEEARGVLHDARALEKIAADRVLIAANHLRRVIYEEFPPARHDALRRRYLPDDKPDKRPFSF
ncbi:MAG: hypothetical protein U5K76_10395 [Woeseiaceae bacterium]|nr:hypothetical protein [Woeseiaceae bacterium]